MLNIARNISITSKFEDAIFFRATCLCCSPDHDHSLTVEHDSETNDITVSIYQELEWAQYDSREGKVKRLFKRVRNALQYLFTGRVKAEGHFLLSRYAAKDYAESILAASAEIERNTTRHAK